MGAAGYVLALAHARGLTVIRERIVLNLLDGNMARRTGKIHPRGELYNELGDRLADVAFLAPVAFLPGASPQIVLLGVLMGVMASYVGITAKAAGGERIYRGILSKPGRMALLVVCCLWAFVAGPADTLAWAVFGPILLAGTTLTLARADRRRASGACRRGRRIVPRSPPSRRSTPPRWSSSRARSWASPAPRSTPSRGAGGPPA